MSDETQEPAAEPEGKPVKYLAQVSPTIREKYGERLEKFPGLNELVEGAMDLEDRQARSVIMPKANAEGKFDPEELKTFKTAMGIPSNADSYEIDESKGKELGIEVGEIKKRAYAAGMTGTQAQKLYDFIAEAGQSSKEARATALDELKGSFDDGLKGRVPDEGKRGEALNLFKAATVRIAKEDKDFYQRLSDSGMLYSPTMAMLLAEHESRNAEEPFVMSSSGGGAPPAKGGTSGAWGGNYSKDWKEGPGAKK